MSSDQQPGEQKAVLEGAYKKLQKIDNERIDLISVIVHQLRSPLATIGLAHQTLLENEDQNLTEQQLYILKNAQMRVTHIHDLTEKLLNLGASKEPQEILNKQEHSLEKFLHEIINAADISAKKRDISLEKNFADRPKPVCFDKSVLRDAVVNIVDNAILYSPQKSTVLIKTKYVDTEACVTIADTGPGVPADEVERLFQKFSRIDNVPDTHPDGMGLGLYIAEQALIKHGGSLTYSPNKPHGSIFTMCIPLNTC